MKMRADLHRLTPFSWLPGLLIEKRLFIRNPGGQDSSKIVGFFALIRKENQSYDMLATKQFFFSVCSVNSVAEKKKSKP